MERNAPINRRRLLASGIGAAALGVTRDWAAVAAMQPASSPVAVHPDFRVRFIRHAESEINVQRTIDVPGLPLPPDSGVTFPLTATGMTQAVALGETMRADPLLALYTSTRLRGTQTADAIAFATGMTLQLEPGLVEVAFTDPDASFSTVDWVAVTRTFTSWLLGDLDAHPQGGESLAEVLARFLPPVQEAIANASGQPGDLLFVSHSVVLAVALPFLFSNLSMAWTLTHVLPYTGIANGTFIDGTLVCTDWNGASPG